MAHKKGQGSTRDKVNRGNGNPDKTDPAKILTKFNLELRFSLRNEHAISYSIALSGSPGWIRIRDQYPGKREDVERSMRFNLEVWAKERFRLIIRRGEFNEQF